MANTVRRVQNQAWWDAQDDKSQLRQENIRARKARTPAQQIKVLDDRLGEGVGAKKERAKLMAQIPKPNQNYMSVEDTY